MPGGRRCYFNASEGEDGVCHGHLNREWNEGALARYVGHIGLDAWARECGLPEPVVPPPEVLPEPSRRKRTKRTPRRLV
jgi:hypothetical protein